MFNFHSGGIIEKLGGVIGDQEGSGPVVVSPLKAYFEIENNYGRLGEWSDSGDDSVYWSRIEPGAEIIDIIGVDVEDPMAF